MLNSITLQGRFTKAPELRYTQSNTPVAAFTLACERDFGEEKQTDFIECVAWRSTGEFISKHFDKGDMCVIKGRLQVRKWEDSNGNKRSTSEINVESVYFAGSKKPAAAEGVPVFSEYDDEDGRLPF